jgi:branched-chain amino acid transport system ATP-binding protein
MLKVNGISVRYDIIPVLDDVSFSVEEGQFVAIVGANSAGKSTILKTVSGLVRPFSGTIKFDEEPIQGAPPFEIASNGISHVPEGRRIFDKLTVLENLLVGAHSRSDPAEVSDTL